MNVYVIETGEYEDRMVWGVATSPEAAVEAIKAAFPSPPNDVTWDDYDPNEGGLVGHFHSLQVGLHSAHTAVYRVYPEELICPVPAPEGATGGR